MSINKAYQKIIEDYVSSYNDFDVTGMIENLSNQIVFENISGGQVNVRTEGLEEFKSQAESAVQYFKTREQKITSWMYDKDVITISIKYKAVLAMDFPNGMKAGDELEMDGESEFVFEGEEIRVIRDRS